MKIFDSKKLLYLILLAGLLGGCGNSEIDRFSGTWIPADAPSDSARIVIADRGTQLFVMFKKMSRGREMEFPAIFNELSKQLTFELPASISSTPATTAYLNGDTLNINNGGHTKRFLKSSRE